MELSKIVMLVVAMTACYAISNQAMGQYHEQATHKLYIEIIDERTVQLTKVKTDRNRVYILNSRGNAYRKQGRYDQAIEDFNNAIQLDPKYISAWNNRGIVYKDKGMYDRAIADFSRAIQLDANKAAVWRNRALAYMTKGIYDRATEDYNKAIQLDPHSLAPLYNMACLYSARKNGAEACRWLKRAIAKGYSDWPHLKGDKYFENIRNEPCYKEILAGK